MNIEQPPKPDYWVTIEIVDPANFRVVWARGLPYRSYLIDKGDVESVSDNIRAQLSELVNNALAKENATKTNDIIQLSEATKSQCEILLELVRCCRELYRILFTCSPESQVGQEYVDRIRERLTSEKTTKSICFLVKSRVYVPWGLLYDGPQPSDLDQTNPDCFPGFWCLRHQVSTIFDTLASPNDFIVTYDRGGFHTLIAGDSAEFEKATQSLHHPAERQLHERLIDRYGDLIVSSVDLVAAWKKQEKQLGLLYLFCHANARTIGFSLYDTMSVVDFKRDLIKSAESPRCLVFLNGCFTSSPDVKGTFFEATGRNGFCGYVGAETEVPSLFAFRFGLAFQRFFEEGMEVVEIMRHLFRQHWPLGLIYGLYAFPHLRISSPECALSWQWPLDNYAEGPLGEKIQ
jgi:hypothetical protein